MEKYNIILLKISIFFAIISIITLVIAAKFPAQTSWFVFAISMTSITIVLGFFQVFKMAREIRKKRTENYNRSLKVTLEVNGDPITIESSDTEQIAEILKLIQDLQVKARIPAYLTINTSEEKVALTEAKEEIPSTSRKALEMEVLQKSEIEE